MASASEKIYRSFVKGIITEASPLTFPENASVDEDNFVLNRNGSRSRRLGIDYESYGALTATGFASSIFSSGKQSFHRWDSPAGDTTVSIGVIRIYNKLWFVNLLAATPSDSLLNSGNPITISNLADSNLETAVINNSLVLVSKDITVPILLTYNTSTQAVSQAQIPIYVRDIWGITDNLAISERPSSLTDLHKYNLRNQGWSTRIVTVSPGDAIDITKTSLGVYPANSDIWTLGKVSNSSSTTYQAYDPAVLAKNSVSNSLVARGSYIIDAFTRGSQRATLSGLTLPQDKENGNFSTVASYASRIFYSGVQSHVTGGDAKSPNYSGYIFFSQVVTENEKLGKCHQEADPTDENINDLIATDGGTIQIPEATRIIKIAATQSSLLVFAENGVWEIFGDTGGFIATSFQVAKVSSNGVLNPKSIVEANGSFIYWSKAGIFALTSQGAPGTFTAQNLSLVTIQKLFLNIPDLAKNNCKGFFDEKENRVRWLYNDTDSYSETSYINKYNRELILDLTLQAFYTHTIESLAVNSPYVCDYIDIPGYSVASVDTDIAVGSEDVIVTSGDQVVVEQALLSNRSSQFSFLTIVGTSFTISKYNDSTFVDWETAGGGTGVPFSSYLVTGYELFGDILRTKQVPYLFCYFDRTEDGFELDGSNLELKNKSSCLVQAQWNWTNSANSGKWGNQFQAYKLLRNYIPSGVSDSFDYGESVIVTRNKLRGSGKCLSLKLESEDGKDMRILGWGVGVTADGKP
jgi:hypothetical protein